jgi:hypothetical protein
LRRSSHLTPLAPLSSRGEGGKVFLQVGKR